MQISKQNSLSRTCSVLKMHKYHQSHRSQSSFNLRLVLRVNYEARFWIKQSCVRINRSKSDNEKTYNFPKINRGSNIFFLFEPRALVIFPMVWKNSSDDVKLYFEPALNIKTTTSCIYSPLLFVKIRKNERDSGYKRHFWKKIETAKRHVFGYARQLILWKMTGPILITIWKPVSTNDWNKPGQISRIFKDFEQFIKLYWNLFDESLKIIEQFTKLCWSLLDFSNWYRHFMQKLGICGLFYSSWYKLGGFHPVADLGGGGTHLPPSGIRTPAEPKVPFLYYFEISIFWSFLVFFGLFWSFFKNRFFGLFYKIWLRRRKFCQIGVLIVIWESSENQFGRSKKKVDKTFEVFWKSSHPSKKP